MSDDIGCCLTEVESCFKLLVPLDLVPYTEDKFFGETSGITEGHAPCTLSRDLATPHESGLSGPQDEEQPCCSKDLVASAYHVGSVVGQKALAQTATKDPSRDEDEHSDPEDFLRSHGLGSHKYTLDVELPSGNWLLVLCSTSTLCFSQFVAFSLAVGYPVVDLRLRNSSSLNWTMRGRGASIWLVFPALDFCHHESATWDSLPL